MSSTPARSAAVNATSWSGDLWRGTNATATAPTRSSTCSTRCTRWRSGSPRAWYWPQSQSDQGAARPIWKPTVRDQNTWASWNGFEAKSRTEKARSVAATKPQAKPRLGLRPGYVSQSGAISSDANFVQPDRAANTPRAAGLETSQKPQTRKHGMIASFVFEFETYWVKGYAAHANASTAPRRWPPKRSPTRKRPSNVRRSKAIAVKCDAGRSSHFPLQPRIR